MPIPHKGSTNLLFVKVATAGGTAGYGECPWIEYRARTMIRLKEGFVVGTNLHDVELLWRRLYRLNHF